MSLTPLCMMEHFQGSIFVYVLFLHVFPLLECLAVFFSILEFWACSPSFCIFTCVCFSTNSASYRRKCYNSSTLLLKNCETQGFHVNP